MFCSIFYCFHLFIQVDVIIVKTFVLIVTIYNTNKLSTEMHLFKVTVSYYNLFDIYAVMQFIKKKQQQQLKNEKQHRKRSK